MAKYNLKWELEQLCKKDHGQARNSGKEGFATQATRQRILSLAAAQLKEGGYANLRVRGLKPKHIEYLTERWKAENLSASTIKNRMSGLRWWAGKIGKSRVIANSNDFYGIERRNYIAGNQMKARELDAERLSLISDKHVQFSLQLQRHFGLRREEAIKFSPSIALQGGVLALRASWCKGGRSREIPIRTKQQHELVMRIIEFVGNGALIPRSKNYVQQLRTYERATSKAGLDKNHGLRHSYARDRYFELSGNHCVANGGLKRAEMTWEQRTVDDAIRLQISRELGHERLQITTIYLGR